MSRIATVTLIYHRHEPNRFYLYGNLSMPAIQSRNLPNIK
jgi:hypothetical protein